MNAAIQSAWLFLLRSSEYCFVDGGTLDYCLRLGGVAFYDGEKRALPFRDAQKSVAMSFVIRGSKTDQARVGYTRRLNRTGLEIDAVEAVVSMLQSRSDEWLSDPLKPLFELESGGAVSGSQISEALKLGASDLGPPGATRADTQHTHSGAEGPRPWRPQVPRRKSFGGGDDGSRNADTDTCSVRLKSSRTYPAPWCRQTTPSQGPLKIPGSPCREDTIR